jgi:glucosamine--fructose-6-phosphate aminotransferase (isomerizing)
VIVACGTAWHAGLVGKYLIEDFAHVPVEVDLASEFRYGHRILDENTLVIPVSQSGETADTLEALRLAKSQGAPVLGVVNVVGSSVSREADGVLYTHAGPEIGVASTKAYTSQLVALALLAIRLGELNNVLSSVASQALISHLSTLPGKISWCLQRQASIQRCTELSRYRDAQHAMFIGRGYNYPSALEGALKLKEISYMHVEGYAAGEMKHGPIALVTPELPVVAIATRGRVQAKMLSNIEEIRAREGLVLAVATEGDAQVEKLADRVFHVPDCFEPFSPIVVAGPLQLFAYYIAVALERDVDQPRNLAKSVTVE